MNDLLMILCSFVGGASLAFWLVSEWYEAKVEHVERTEVEEELRLT